MSEETPQPSRAPDAEPTRGLKQRFADDLASGKTVALSSAELADPKLRQELPRLLDAAARSASVAPGAALPGYRLLAEIGRGGMGTVYLARQEKLDRHVAVKVAPKLLGEKSRAQRMLAKEAATLARLAHPNIVDVYDVVDDEDVTAIAMEWVDGSTLAAVLGALSQRAGADDLARIRATLGAPEDGDDGFEETSVRFFVRVVRDVARAAHAAHEAGVLHLDIKPSNLLLRRDGTPLLADFGVTRDLTDSREVAQPQTMVGTPIYSPPEQLRRRDRDIGRPSDVYSLGLTLYEAVARAQPLRGLDLPGIVQCVEAGSMPRLSTLAATPPDLENIVHKAIAPEPQRRYQTAAALADDLDAFLQHRPVSARPLGPTERLRRWARHQPWKAALAVALAVLLPAVASLATYLLQQLPVLSSAQERQRLIIANQIKQGAMQRYLTMEVSLDEAIEMLEAAQLLDPGGTAHACLVALANEAGWWRARQELEAHETAGGDDALWRALAAKRADERRSFFSDDERAQLRASRTAEDRYALALDLVFAATDQPSEPSARAALRALEEAARSVAPDPLLMGLSAWFAARCEDRERYADFARGLKDGWPEDPSVHAWAVVAIEPFDGAAARRGAKRMIEDAPANPRGHELAVAAHLRAGAVDEAIAAADAAAAAGLTSKALTRLRMLASAERGQPEAIQQCIEDAQSGALNLKRQLMVLAEHRPAAFEARVRALLAPEQVAPKVLEEIYLMAKQNVALADEVWPRYAASFPDRRRLHEVRMFYLFRERDLAAVAKLGREVHLQRGWADSTGVMISVAFVQERDWSALRRVSQEWVALGEEREQASFFLGLACARLGALEEAAGQLDRATSLRRVGKTWFSSALLELAHLRARPDAPERLRDPPRALALLARFDEEKTRGNRPGPWTSLVRATVHEANGELERAREHVAQGLRARRRENQAPVDVQEQLQALAARLR